MELKILAENNLLALNQNPYPGRGIIVGMDESGKYLIQVYWIMGRSKKSRNRVFISEADGVLKTEVFDKALLEPGEDASLIIYTAMYQFHGKFAVSNGDQTTAVLDGDAECDFSWLRAWQYEPDYPNYTPRITAAFALDADIPLKVDIAILKKSPFNEMCDRYFYTLAIPDCSLGYCVTTYEEDGNPLPSFKGDPYLLPLKGNIDDVLQSIWDALDEDNRVSLAVKFINIQTREIAMRIVNKNH